MMRAEVSQPPTLAPGFALVTISDADSLDPATLQFSVENPPRGFMQEHIETPWGTTHAWLRPAAAASVADGMELTLGPDRTWFMRPNVTYVMRLRDAAKPSPLTLRIAWKGIRMPSQAPGRLPDPAPKPATDETVKLAEPPAEAIQMEPVVAEPPRVEAPRVVVRPGGNKKVLIGVAALLLLLAACVLAWFYLKRTPSPGTPVQAEAMPPPMPSTAVLVLGGDERQAADLQDSSYKMWNLAGVEPEQLDYAKMQITAANYELRPEIIESTYYLYHSTHDAKYLAMGQTYFDALHKYCRTDEAYAALADVRTKKQKDSMESFFFAETLKYLYLLFAPESTLPFDSVIFNTEAHPMQRSAGLK